MTRKCPQCQKRLRYPEHHEICPDCGYEVAEWFEKTMEGWKDSFVSDGGDENGEDNDDDISDADESSKDDSDEQLDEDDESDNHGAEDK